MEYRLNPSFAKLLFRHFGEFIFYYIAALLCLYFTHYIQSILPFYAKDLADFLATGEGNFNIYKFIWPAIGILVFRTGSRLLFFYPARIQQRFLRSELLHRLENAPPIRYFMQAKGQIFQVLFDDVDQLRAFVGFGLLQVGNVIIAIAVILPKLMSFHRDLVWGLLPMTVCFVIFTIVMSYLRDKFTAILEMKGDVQNLIIESYAGKKSIKNFHAEKSFIELFKMYSNRELETFFRVDRKMGYMGPMIPFGVGLSLLLGAYIIQRDNLGASALVLYSGFIFLFLEPLLFLSWIGIVFTQSFAAWGRLKKFFISLETSTEKELSLLENNQNIQGESGVNFNIEFWDRNLTLKIPFKSWTVFIGKTGHGKSYLLEQMAAILKNKDISLTYVAQDPYVYDDTIQNNIFLGHSPSDEQLSDALSLLKLFALDYLAGSDEALLKMEVGERGKRLSGGQVKRLALVRSLMLPGEFIIWDDPFSSIDILQEKQILDRLKQLPTLKEKTFILSSHRLSTVQQCENVFYIDNENGLVESGRVDELLTNKGMTYEYFSKQMV